MVVAAPVIEAEMAEWIESGGYSSGIEGNRSHTSGFHRAANEIPATDYSRRRDPNGPDGPYVDWDYACAGDFGHGGNEQLRAMHRVVLAELMAGQHPMICEFIGQPWADRPVKYWARWEGVTNLRNYTGSGHDRWSHISWYRSRVNQRAYLWRQDMDQKTFDQRMDAWLISRTSGSTTAPIPTVYGRLKAFPIQYTGGGTPEPGMSVLNIMTGTYRMVERIAKEIQIDEAELAAIKEAARQGVEAGSQSIIDGVVARLPDDMDDRTRDVVKGALREVLVEGVVPDAS